MIEVKDLTKQYGPVVAVRGVSFQVEKGEILGFLGPNGAGKTTTMRILTGYFPATSGTARVAGFDIFKEPLEAKKRIGYMPENVPLYTDMTVRQYIDMVCDLRKVPRDIRKTRVPRLMEEVGILNVRDRFIKSLSKGYRQRVGLAQAMVHDPEVLILDEPTVGLDPRQINEIRNLIKGLKGKRTIILSTHILPEVSMTCDRVIIIHNGRIVKDSNLKDLETAAAARMEIGVEVGGDPDVAIAVIRGVEGVEDVIQEQQTGDSAFRLRVLVRAGEDVRARISSALVGQEILLREIHQRRATLEDIFIQSVSEEVAINA